MIIASEKIYRSIAAQKEFSFVLEAINSNSSGIFNFGFSGVSGQFDFFKFASGKIYDFNNRYVWSYNPREEINISGNVGNNFINYFINETPLCLYSPYQSSYFNNFYAESKNNTVDFSFYLNGNNPNYDIIFPEIVMNGSNAIGTILNKNLNKEADFKIFSGNIFNVNSNFALQSFENKNISGGNSGEFLLTSQPFNLLEEINVNFILTLSTNFGDIVKKITTKIVPYPVYFIDFITGYTGIRGLVSDQSLSKVYDYELRVISKDDVPVYISLENEQGHDSNLKIYEDFIITGDAEGVLSNFIHGFDYVTGNVQGFGSSNVKNYYGNNVTGFFNIFEKKIQYATGDINYKYNLPLFGGSGLGEAPVGTIIIGSGIKTGSLKEDIFILEKAAYPINIDLTGYYNGYLNVVNELIYIPVYFTGDINVNYLNHIWSGNVTGIGFTGFYNKIYGITGGQNFIVSGNPLSSNSGYINYNNTIFSNQSTGIFLKDLVVKNTSLFINSGSGFASENNSLASLAFTGNNYFYFNNVTGFIGIFFNNYNSNDKENITYYSFAADYNTKFFPYIFDLQYSTNGVSWVTVDSRVNTNFYNSDPKIFKLTTQIPNSYNYVRLKITSGEVWSHQIYTNNLNNSIGIKNFEVYSDKLVYGHNLNINNVELIPNLCGYFSSDICESSSSSSSILLPQTQSFWIGVNL
jgi:hypothetical protein